MVFNSTFNNISVLMVEKEYTKKTTDKLIMLYQVNLIIRGIQTHNFRGDKN